MLPDSTALTFLITSAVVLGFGVDLGRVEAAGFIYRLISLLLMMIKL
jgi:hypothetical protein